MRGMKVLSIVILAVLCLPAVARAQDEEAKTSYVYATYFQCEVSKQWRADEIANSVFAPAYNAAVEDGTISSWGWLAHHTGGHWRRVLYYTAPGVDALLDVQAAIDAKIPEGKELAQNEFSAICGIHDDYIWEAGASSAGAGVVAKDRGKAGMSVYMYCDMAQEERADEIFEKVYAPALNRQVANGNLTSWGWLKHFVGGKWRRAEISTAKDHKSLLAARNAIIEEITKNSMAEDQEFSEICGSHQDYLWNIEIEKP